MNKHRSEQPPNLAVSDFRQAQVGRNIIISDQERADEQTLDWLEVRSKPRADKNYNADNDEYKRQRPEAIAGQWAEQVTPVAQPVTPGFLPFDAPATQGFRPPRLLAALPLLG